MNSSLLRSQPVFPRGHRDSSATEDEAQVNVPFTMDGTIALFLDQARTTPLLSNTIAGHGTASADFVSFEGGWAFLSHDYFF